MGASRPHWLRNGPAAAHTSSPCLCPRWHAAPPRCQEASGRLAGKGRHNQSEDEQDSEVRNGADAIGFNSAIHSASVEGSVPGIKHLIPASIHARVLTLAGRSALLKAALEAVVPRADREYSAPILRL